MQKWYMLKKLILVRFFKGDQKNLSYQETKNITRSVLKKAFRDVFGFLITLITFEKANK